jgi:RsiW-degrading membrane proteinase PrsW (M82 family)
MQITLFLTIGTPLIIIAVIIFSDKFREPIDMILKTFLLGVFLCLPAGLINSIFIPSIEYAYRAGFTEETLKFLIMFYFIRKYRSFDEPMDAIVYGTLVSLGFATLENIEYVYLNDTPVSSLAVASIRALSAIPLHAACGVIMGYYFGLYAFSASRFSLVKSLVIPISIHAIYNYLIVNSELLMMIFLTATIKYTYGLHKEVFNIQKSKTNEHENKLI